MSGNTTPDYFPFTKYLASITKYYYGAISKKLQNLDIDRYYYTLVLIAEHEGQFTQQMLAERLEIDKVSMVRIIDYLSKKGYVQRKKNPVDRREHLLEITTKGEKVVPQIKQAFYDINQAAFEGLSSEEAGSFLHCAQTIKNNLSEIPALDFKLEFNRTRKKSNSKQQYEKTQLSKAK